MKKKGSRLRAEYVVSEFYVRQQDGTYLLSETRRVTPSSAAQLRSLGIEAQPPSIREEVVSSLPITLLTLPGQEVSHLRRVTSFVVMWTSGSDPRSSGKRRS